MAIRDHDLDEPHDYPAPLPRRRRRGRNAFLLILLLLALGAAFLAWQLSRESSRARVQALVVAAVATEGGPPNFVAKVLTYEPRPLEPHAAAQLPATIVRPGGRDGASAPAIVIVVSGTPDAEGEADLQLAQQALARAGLMAWTVRLAGEAADDPAVGTQLLAEALAEVAADESTRRGHVSAVAVGETGSQLLLAATNDAVRDDLRAVLVVQPIADVLGLVRLAVTGTTRDAKGGDSEHRSAEAVRGDAGRALVRAVLEQGGDAITARDREVLAAAEASDDPLGSLEGVPSEVLSPDLQTVQDVLASDDPEEFDERWQELPAGLLTGAAALSPSAVTGDVEARVLIVEPRDDARYPAADGERLAAELEDARLVRTELVDPDPGRPGLEQLRTLLPHATWWLERAGA